MTQALVDEIVERMASDGICIVTSLFEPTEIEAAREAAFSASLVPDKTGARLMLDGADTLPEMSFFFNSQVISDVFSRLIGDTVVCRRRRLQLRSDQGVSISPILLYHIDSAVPRFKVFLYLVDVSDSDGPFEYLVGSHIGAWRECYLHEVREAIENNASDVGIEGLDYHGCLKTDTEVSSVMARHPLRRVVGQRGTCVLFDTRGFHRASPFQAGTRMLLSTDWMSSRDNP